MTVVILNKKTKGERAHYENVIDIMVTPRSKFTELWLSFEHEDRMEVICDDEYMKVK